MLLGIDLGGTKIEGIVLKSKENPIEIIRHRVDTMKPWLEWLNLGH